MPDPATYTWPATVLDRPPAVLAALGGLWNGGYAGGDLVEDLCAAVAARQRQAYDDAGGLLDACDRRRIRPLRRRRWLPLVLTRSAGNDQTYQSLRFGDGTAAFDAAGPHRFGVPESRPLFAWPLPAGLAAAPVLTNRIAAPGLTLVENVDYRIDAVGPGGPGGPARYVVFRDDPFDDPLVAYETVFEGNAPVDRVATLWACDAAEDYGDLYGQFGYVLGVPGPSTPAYRDLVNALFDCLVEGPTARAVRRAWSAAAGVALSGDGGEAVERVERVERDDRRTLVVTDRAVYAFDPDATPLVAAGDAVGPAGPLTDGLQFFEFNAGQCPAPADVPGLVLGRGLLGAGFYADLAFENADVPLAAEADPDGYTKVSWRLAGWPGDAAEFFAQLHANGRAAGRTLAHLLDTRPPGARDTEPTAGALPATINPMAFLCENVLRDNAWLVKVKPGAGRAGVGLNAIKALRRFVPPWTAMLVLVELAAAGDTVTMGGEDDEGGTFVSIPSDGDTLGPGTLSDDGGRAYPIRGRCQ